MRGLLLVLATAGAVLLVGPASAALDRAAVPGATAAMPPLYKNCTNYNKRYPHGVGTRLARDKVKPGNEPVTNFRRSTVLYNRAMGYNRGLDRDKDKVACEKA